MPVYAIGDVQGCARTLDKLLARIGFDPAADRLWFAGDLVNRGPRSLAVLRRVRALGAAAVVVLGNHDLHLIARSEGAAKPKRRDTIDDVLGADDRHELVAWLCARPLLHVEGGYALVHAGLPPGMTLAEVTAAARAAERMLAAGPEERTELLRARETAPRRWPDARDALGRAAFVVNALTRMRVCRKDGALELAFDAAPDRAPAGTRPWYAFGVPPGVTVLHGHWSTLGFERGAGRISLDSGCVYGDSLTAVRLGDGRVWQQAFAD